VVGSGGHKPMLKCGNHVWMSRPPRALSQVILSKSLADYIPTNMVRYSSSFGHIQEEHVRSDPYEWLSLMFIN
jgi:hypothetical protein